MEGHARRKIMVVDDSGMMLRAIKTVLEEIMRLHWRIPR